MPTANQLKAKTIVVGEMQFDHADMIKARSMWAEALREGKVSPEAVDQLVVYFHVDTIRDRLLADVINPYAWDEAEYRNLFLGYVDTDFVQIGRMRTATEVAIQIIEATSPEDNAPLIMMMSFIQWFLGQNDLAMQGTYLALAAQPGYAIAELMQKIIIHNVRPGWMQSEKENP
jgi:hypothetical protein